MPASGSVQPLIRFGSFEVDVRGGRLRKHGMKIRLQQQPFQVLLVLLERAGEVVSREELQKAIWPADTFVDFDLGLATAVHKLRQALGDSAEEPRFIETLPKRGYRFLGAIDAAPSLPAVAVCSSPTQTGPTTEGFQSADRETRPTRDGKGERDSRNSGETLAHVADGFPATTPAEITDAEGKPRQITGVSIGALGLETRAAAPAARSGLKHRRIYLIALCAVVVLILSITAARTLAFRSHAAVLRAQPSIEAQRAYNIGRYELDRWTPDDLSRSAQFFQQAVQYDPDYAAAWAGLSRSQNLLAIFSASREQMVAKAKESALKALACDPSLPEAHAAMAGVLMHGEWSWIAAGAEIRRALALDPNNADAHQFYGYWLVSQARLAEAVTEMEKAQALAPQSPNKRNSLAVALFYSRRYDEALNIWRKNAAVEANSERRHLRLALIYDAKGRHVDSIAELAALLRGRTRLREADEVERIFHRHGYAEARRAFFQHDIASSPADGRAAFEIAADYIALGDNDRALAALSRAVARHATSAMYLSVDPRFDPVRSDVRFSAILRSIGLPLR